jgi:hypothetical protein
MQQMVIILVISYQVGDIQPLGQMENLPNKNFDHVYVVIRCDAYAGLNESRVTVLKVFTSETEAINEVSRLQKISDERKRRLGNTSGITSEYSYQLGRIKKGTLVQEFCNEV